MQIHIKPKSDLTVSTWATDRPFLIAGEQATITGFFVACEVNPLYSVRRDRDGALKAIYRDDLVKCGALMSIA